MKRIIFIFIAIGILLIVFCSVVYNDAYFLTALSIPYFTIILGLKKCIKENRIIPIASILVWTTIYNFIYLFCNPVNKNNYNEMSQIIIRLGIPCFLGFILEKLFTEQRS